VPNGGQTARSRPHACQRTTFGTTTFDLLVTGAGCDTALTVVESFQVDRKAPRGWTCMTQFCWRGARTYERARTRIAVLVDVTVEPGPISAGKCENGRVAISARQYIGCAAARKALGAYLAPRPPGGSLVSCNGDAKTGGFCTVTFVSGAQGRFAYARMVRP
jgi:hypothetical protein